jgi:heptosyltransferase-2
VDYFISTSSPKIDFNTDQDYICWCIGGTYEKKKLSVSQIKNVISKLQLPVLLIGGKVEKKISLKIFDSLEKDNLFDFCGVTTIDQSAYLMKKSSLVLTNDTGMMHIASAFDIPIISFWGCTKPSLGFSPYLSSVSSQNIITSLSKRPCSKHGQFCRFQSEGCIKEIDENIILNTIDMLLK